MQSVRIIIVEPKNPGNLGAIARLMKNFGLKDLTVVNINRIPSEDLFRSMKGSEILSKCRMVSSLQDAIKGLDYVAGTSGVKSDSPKEVLRNYLEPKEFVRLTSEIKGKIGIVLGREDIGLVNEELGMCDFFVHIPADDAEVKDIVNLEVRNLSFSLSGTKFVVDTQMDTYEVELKALGEHQVSNSIAAILACESINEKPSKSEITQGLKEDQIPARFEVRRSDPLLILDGAHNSEASRILSSNIRRYSVKDPLIVLGVLRDKNSYNILQNLSEVSDSILITEPDEPERKKDGEELKREARLFFKEVYVQKRPSEALEAALKENRNTIITGSLYLVGEMELLLDEKDKSKMVPVEMEEAGNATGPVKRKPDDNQFPMEI